MNDLKRQSSVSVPYEDEESLALRRLIEAEAERQVALHTAEEDALMDNPAIANLLSGPDYSLHEEPIKRVKQAA